MCKQTVLRFRISLRGTFSNPIAFTVINEYDKRVAVQIYTVFETVDHVASPRVLRSGTFLIFISAHFRKCVISDIHQL